MRRVGSSGVWALILVTGTLLCGCSHQDLRPPLISSPFGHRPSTRREAASDTPAEERDALLAKLAAELSRSQAESLREYRLGPGDEIRVSIFALESPDRTTVLQRAIPPEQVIPLPWVGDISTSNCTVRELEQRIAAAYADRFIKNPQVAIEVVQFKSRTAIVTGSVRNPGVYALTGEQNTLIELLSRAGGLASDASDEVLVVRGLENRSNGGGEGSTVRAAGGEALTVNLQKLLYEGDMRENIVIYPGDVITVKPEKSGYFYVLGYVARPGVYPLRSGQRIDPVKAVAMAGGLHPVARPEYSYLVRTTEKGQEVIRINLVKMTHNAEEPMLLESGDTLIVGSTFLSRLTEIVRPSVGMGMSYSPVP